MSSRLPFPLLARVLAWLLLHCLILGLAFVGFVSWQLGLGLDSLLSGAAGERLKDFGDSVKAELDGRPPATWNESITNLAKQRDVVAAVIIPEDIESYPFHIPPNVLERIRVDLPPPMGRPRPAPPHPEDDAGDFEELPPPRPRSRPSRGQPPPPEGPFSPTGFVGLVYPKPETKPVFLVRGDGGDGYWAGVHFHLSGAAHQPPRRELLLVRSDRLDGSGMFFEFKPWLWGGLAVLILSLAFWTPFVWGITRYIRRLTMAADRIASGQFDVILPARGNDELGNLGAAIQSMSAQLGHLISGQKRFLGDAAHEICAPLARIRTGLGILEMKLSEESKTQLASIEVDTQELATLVEEILAFSRAGNCQPRLRPVAIEPLLNEVVARESKSIQCTILSQKGLTLITDATLLSRAVSNLIRNTTVHAGIGAQVVLRVSELPDFIDITLTDDGPGVPAEELSRLFEPFYRPDRSRSRDTGGSGLGLAIVKTAVEACGGTVFASLPPTGGFAVSMLFPKNPPNHKA
jgi:two-component system, OmpR family, sensor histidine kinase CpxA